MYVGCVELCTKPVGRGLPGCSGNHLPGIDALQGRLHALRVVFTPRVGCAGGERKSRGQSDMSACFNTADTYVLEIHVLENPGIRGREAASGLNLLNEVFITPREPGDASRPVIAVQTDTAFERSTRFR